MHRCLLRFFVALALASVVEQRSVQAQNGKVSADSDRVGEVDALKKKVAKNIGDRQTVVVIDHARLAKKAGVPMPPSVVTIFSDPAVNSPLMMENPRIGMDLPFKVLAYAEPHSNRPSIAFASADYLAARHGIDRPELLAAYRKGMAAALNGISEEVLSPVKSESITLGYGLIELKSEYSMSESVERLKTAVLAQGDTVWFGQIDYQEEAATIGIQIPAAQLLLFGGPAPGGKAMAEFPKLGLDAFCQKLLVYEEADGGVKVLFNDIVAFAKLHYDKSNLPQRVINGRLKKTFGEAIKRKQ